MSLRRFLALVLCFVLGFMSCIGVIVGGGYLVYSKVSLDKLSSWGISPVDPDKIRDPEAEVDIAKMTLAGLVDEYFALVKQGDEMTLDAMITRYGLKLPETVEKWLPDGARALPFATLVSGEGMQYVMDHTYMDYLFGIMPEGTLSEPAQEAMKGKTLSDLVEMDLLYLLEGVKLGYIAGVKYEKDADGNYVAVFANPENPTMVELLGEVELSKVLKVVSKGGDLGAVMVESLGDVVVADLLKSVSSGVESPLSKLFGGATFRDIMVLDEKTGVYTLSISALLGDRYLGDVLELTQIKQGEHLIGWMDKNGAEVFGINRGLAFISFKGMDQNNIDFNKLLAGLYIGDVLEYRPVYDADGNLVSWRDASGVELDRLHLALADMTVEKLSGGDFEIGTILEGIYVGDVLDYVRVEEEDPLNPDTMKLTGWTKLGVPVKGIDLVAANIDLGRLMSDDTYQIADELKGIAIGEMLGYEPIYNGQGTALTDIVGWTDPEKGGARVTGVLASIGKFTLDNVADGVETIVIGELLGYDPVYDTSVPPVLTGWRHAETGEEMEGVMLAFADMTINDLRNSDKVSAAVKKVTVAEAMGYGYRLEGEPGHEEKVWYEKDSEGQYTIRVNETMQAIADKKVGELPTIMDELTVAEAMGYTKTVDAQGNVVWYDEGKPVEGVVKSVADTKIADLPTKLDTLLVGDAMGYTYRMEGEPGQEQKIWYEMVNGVSQPVQGVMKTLAHKTVKELPAAMDTLLVGDAMGYTKVGVVWMEEKGGSLVPVTGAMKALSDKKVTGLSAAINDMKVHELMDYRQVDLHGDGKLVWCEKDEDGNYTKQVNGLIAALAEKKAKDIGPESGNLLLGRVMNFEPVYDGQGTDDVNIIGWTDPAKGGAPASGLLAAFAMLKVNDMKNEDKVADCVQNVTVAEAMGYEYDEDAECWTSHRAPVSSIMNAIADHEVGSLSVAIDDMYIGEVLGYSRVDKNDPDSDWTDGTATPLSPLSQRLAKSKISEMNDTIDNLTVGDVFTTEELNNGFLKLLSPTLKISELGVELPEIFSNTTMGKYVEAGIITLSPENEAKLDNIDLNAWRISTGNPTGTKEQFDADTAWKAANSWRAKTIQQFIDYLTTNIPAV